MVCAAALTTVTVTPATAQPSGALTAGLTCATAGQWAITCHTSVVGGKAPYTYRYHVGGQMPYNSPSPNMGQSCYGSEGMVSVVVSVYDAAGARDDGVDMAYCGGIIP
ncbi:hypothetical protein ALI22I_00575 [Saccharothrix sp. ALI-22-I]|nr:hypothetical protein ALI22I_00575 [Saccharothrix sp. ALI-22-I]